MPCIASGAAGGTKSRDDAIGAEDGAAGGAKSRDADGAMPRLEVRVWRGGK